MAISIRNIFRKHCIEIFGPEVKNIFSSVDESMCKRFYSPVELFIAKAVSGVSGM